MSQTTSPTRPILARTWTAHQPDGPVAHDCVKVCTVREGSAILFSEFGRRHVHVGHVILLGANTLCGSEPEGQVTVTTVYLDTQYVIDQVFWQHFEVLQDRLDAQEFAAATYAEPAQILPLGESRAGVLMPWLDELTSLSARGSYVDDFYRLQALWFSIAQVIDPFIKTTPIRVSSTQRAAGRSAAYRHHGFAPLRREAHRAAELLRADPGRRWSMSDLADELHLSKSQVGRVFVNAYGKSPIAYLTMLRIERMAALLRSTNTPITMIAREVGWGDPNFAARQFSRAESRRRLLAASG